MALITESAQVFVEERTILGIERARDFFRAPEQFDRLRKFHGDKAEWVLNAWTETWLGPTFAAWSLESVLPALACPVMTIHGANDEYGTSRHPQRMAELAGGPVRVEILPDTRHFPHREKELKVVELVRDFVQGIQ